MIHDLCCPSPVSRHLPHPKGAASAWLVCPLSATPERFGPGKPHCTNEPLTKREPIVGASLPERDLLAVWN